MISNVIEKKQPIKGKVAGILTEREITINVGSLNGVYEGMKFKVLANSPMEVTDPETGEKLGIIDREKVRVAATEIQEKFSVCRTYRVKVIGGWNFPNLAALNVRQEFPETLKVEDSQLPQPLSEEESYVKVGDRVIQLVEDEE